MKNKILYANKERSKVCSLLFYQDIYLVRKELKPENEKILYGNNQEKSTNVSEKIDLLGGKNTLSVAITEENGQVTIY